MNLLHRTLFFAIAALISLQTINAQEAIPYRDQELLQGQYIDPYTPVNLGIRYDDAKVSKESPLVQTDFRIIDSLANGYSFYTNSQQPFVYEPTTGTLVMIKRGANSRDDLTAGENILDNIFVYTSPDWGDTWDDGVQVFDTDDQGGLMARYPSVYSFVYEGGLTHVYTGPATQSDGWEGVYHGIFLGGEEYTSDSDFRDETQDVPGVTFSSMTGTAILGGETEAGDPFAFLTTDLFPENGTPRDEMSNIAYRRTDDFGVWDLRVPEEWAADNFYSYTLRDSISCSRPVGMAMDEEGTMYMALTGFFPEDKLIGTGIYDFRMQWHPAVSISEDMGQTWSELEVSPLSMIRDYLTGQGVENPDSCYMDYEAGFTLLPNGWTFGMYISESVDTSRVPFDEQLHQLVEVFYENGSGWGVRKIADLSGWILTYPPEPTDPSQQRRNQMGREFQISGTVDGSKLLAKWVDLVPFDLEGQSVNTLDIFITARNVDGEWGVVRNISESTELDRITWIPTLLPNDLNGVPVLRNITKPVAGDDVASAFERQFHIYDPQYVKIGKFDGAISLDVEDEEKASSIRIEEPYPNPASDQTVVVYELPNAGGVSIDLYDAFGSKVKTCGEGFASPGIRSATIATGDLPAGAYYLSIEFGGEKHVKLINVIR